MISHSLNQPFQNKFFLSLNVICDNVFIIKRAALKIAIMWSADSVAPCGPYHVTVVNRCNYGCLLRMGSLVSCRLVGGVRV